MKEPQASIIIPLWNAEDYIEEAIRSVLMSGESVGEIVIVDNASTDASMARVRALASDKIRLIGNNENVGAARARHQAILASKFDFISFLDADDFVSPGAITAGMARIVSSGADLSNFSMKVLPASGVVQDFLPAVEGVITGMTAFERTVGDWSIHPMGVMRKSLYMKATDQFVFHGHSDDELLTRHIFLHARTITGNSGNYVYRKQAVKQASLLQMIGRARTTQEVLRLALSVNLDSDQRLRTARNQLIRAILGLTRRLRSSDEASSQVHDLLINMSNMNIRWDRRDWSALALYKILTLYWRVNRSNQDHRA